MNPPRPVERMNDRSIYSLHRWPPMLRGRSSSGDSWERNCGVPLSRAELVRGHQTWVTVEDGEQGGQHSRQLRDLKKVMRFDHSASSSNLQEELIALVTDCKVAVTAWFCYAAVNVYVSCSTPSPGWGPRLPLIETCPLPGQRRCEK